MGRHKIKESVRIKHGTYGGEMHAGKPERKRILEKPRRRQKDNIKVDQTVEWRYEMDLSGL
jgi:hypothetical protein